MFDIRHFPRFRAMARNWQILALTAGLSSFPALAQTSPCDLNGDGKTDVVDVQTAVNLSMNPATCTPSVNILGAGVCTADIVPRVIDAALGKGCVTGHSAILTWAASTSPNVTYNVYRGTSTGGESALPLNATPITVLTYTDSTVQLGQTYYYVVKAVGSGNSLSVASNEIPANIPTS
jgi:hypothetical protein